jgi:hypothetical protein
LISRLGKYIDQLARYADEELNRTVDVEEEEDPYHSEDDAPGAC